MSKTVRKYTDVIRRNTKIYLESLGDDLKARKNANFFWPTGTQVYVGRQGSGKTISAVRHLIELKQLYPKLLIVSNLNLSFIDAVSFRSRSELRDKLKYEFNREKNYVLFTDIDELGIALTQCNNGHQGVVYVIDEIHTYFNALESKNIPPYIFTEISQQRKQRKLIIGTSQLFMRMAKPFREQCDNLIICRTFFGFFTTQKAYDGMTLTQDYDGRMSGDLKKRGYFFHNRFLRQAFDTYQKVVSGNAQFEEMQRAQEFTISEKKQKRLK